MRYKAGDSRDKSQIQSVMVNKIADKPVVGQHIYVYDNYLRTRLY